MPGLLDGIGAGQMQQPNQQSIDPSVHALANQMAALQQQLAVQQSMIQQLMNRQSNFEVVFRRGDNQQITGASLISR